MNNSTLRLYSVHISVFIIGFVFTTVAANADKNKNVTQKSSKRELMEYARKLNLGFQLIRLKKPEQAMTKYFNPILATYQKKFPQDGNRYFCARNQKEALAYLLSASQKKTKKGKTSIISDVWCNAQFGKAQAYIVMKKWPQAKVEMFKAVSMSPQNAQYLSELGHIYHAEKNWADALKIFKRAEKATQFSSPQYRKVEKTRAIRGIGFSLIEMGRLHEARQEFQRCLKINPKDKRALNELTYIKQLEQAKKINPKDKRALNELTYIKQLEQAKKKQKSK
jgi:tetratricopeptide (TPR) repeat protein